MTVLEKLEAYPLFDVAVLHHSFSTHMRDYDLLIEADWRDDRAGRYQYRFTHCVEAQCRTVLNYDSWQRSWDDVFTNYEEWERAGSPEGYVWGVNWSLAYPGYEHITESPKARAWSEGLNKAMHEVQIETNAYKLQIIFHDLKVRKIGKDTDLIEKVFIPLDE